MDKSSRVLIWEDHAEPLHRRYMRGQLPDKYLIVNRVVRSPIAQTDYGVVKIWDRHIYIRRVSPITAQEDLADWESVSPRDIPHVQVNMHIEVPLLARDGTPARRVARVIHTIIALYDLQQFTVHYSGDDEVAAQRLTFYSIQRNIKILNTTP